MQKHLHYDEAEKSVIAQFAQSTGNAMREDESVFAARELDYVKARVYEKKRPPMLAWGLFRLLLMRLNGQKRLYIKPTTPWAWQRLWQIMPMTCRALMCWAWNIPCA